MNRQLQCAPFDLYYVMVWHCVFFQTDGPVSLFAAALARRYDFTKWECLKALENFVEQSELACISAQTLLLMR